MKSRALVATLFTSVLVSALIVTPGTQASASTCYTVVSATLTVGTACSGAVTIDSSVTSIGDNAFDSNTALTSIVIPSTVTSLGRYAFNDNTALTNVTLNTGLITIGEHAFQGNTGLESIVIPSTVTSLGRYAFNGNTALTNVTLNTGLITIGDHAFQGNTSLESIVIPSTVTSLGRYAFNGNTALTNVTLNTGLITIGDHAFQGNTSLESIVIPSTVTSLGRYAFNGDTALTNVTLNTGLILISDFAFQGTTSLESIVIPSTVISIGAYAFNGSSALTSIGIGSSVATIGEGGFQDTGLTSIIIPSSVVSIGNDAFKGSTSLISVGLGSRVATVGQSAFEDATSLTCLRASGTAPVAGTNAFTNTPDFSSLFFVAGTSGWSSSWAGLTTTAQTLLPATGSQSGGTSITLTSCGLTGIASVLFGGVPATFAINSDGALTATSPVGSPGTVDVEVQDSMGVRQKVGSFTYIANSVPPAPVVPVDTPVAVTPVQVPTPVVDPPKPPLGNPSQPTVIAPGAVLVSETQAQATAPREMRNAPAGTIRNAPVVQSQTGSATALIAPGLTPRAIYQVRIKVEGEYRDLGYTQAAVDGDAALPVFRLTRAGLYAIVLTNSVDGSVQYLKVRVNKRR